MSDEVQGQQDGPIFRITLNRPDRGNAVSDEMTVELTRLIRDAAATSELIVLRGAGKDFCAGRAAMGVPPARPPEALERRRFSDVVFDCYGALRNSPIPVVGVVEGRALGFGLAIAACCDITVASEDAIFQAPEMAHNILPTMVLSSLIDRASRKAIAYLVHSTAQVGAERALSYGIVSEVFPAASFEERVKELCANMLKAPPVASRGVKEYLKAAGDMPIQGAVDFARNLHATINSSSEIRPKKPAAP